MATKKKSRKDKLFVVDTNVLLHDFRCIYNFQDNDIVIPIVVLEELDRFKKGSDLINLHAREFTREMDKLSGDNLFTEGIKLGKGHGMLYIETGKPFSEHVSASFPETTADHRILAITDWLKGKEEHKNKEVILITKDINLRMKAKSLGIMAQDYESDKVTNIDELASEIKTIEGVDDTVIGRLYKEIESIPWDDFKLATEPLGHEYMILKGAKSSVLAHYEPTEKKINRVEKTPAYGIEPRNAEQTFALNALMDPSIQLVSITGKAGTGKTLLALASAIQQRKAFHQIYLARPIVPLSNKDMGFLPGDVREKLSPYMQPLMDNLNVIKHQYKPESQDYVRIDEMIKNQKLLITPLAYIRGRSLSKVFFIVDEAQNLTPHEIKTIITRAGEGTKMVFTGDIQQIDSPYLDAQSNGLSYLTEKMKDQNIFAHMHLVKGERSYLAELASNLL
jgi:PhoH-like ATPase